MTCIQVEELLV